MSPERFVKGESERTAQNSRWFGSSYSPAIRRWRPEAGQWVACACELNRFSCL